MTTEELKVIRKRAYWVGTTSPAGGRWNLEACTVVAFDVPALCAEVERLQEAITKALVVSQRFGSIDGDHHKAWVIDQMVRELTGPGYVEFVTQAKVGGYDWDEGIAP